MEELQVKQCCCSSVPDMKKKVACHRQKVSHGSGRSLDPTPGPVQQIDLIGLLKRLMG